MQTERVPMRSNWGEPCSVPQNPTLSRHKSSQLTLRSAHPSPLVQHSSRGCGDLSKHLFRGLASQEALWKQWFLLEGLLFLPRPNLSVHTVLRCHLWYPTAPASLPLCWLLSFNLQRSAGCSYFKTMNLPTSMLSSSYLSSLACFKEKVHISAASCSLTCLNSSNLPSAQTSTETFSKVTKWDNFHKI